MRDINYCRYALPYLLVACAAAPTPEGASIAHSDGKADEPSVAVARPVIRRYIETSPGYSANPSEVNDERFTGDEVIEYVITTSNRSPFNRRCTFESSGVSLEALRTCEGSRIPAELLPVQTTTCGGTLEDGQTCQTTFTLDLKLFGAAFVAPYYTANWHCDKPDAESGGTYEFSSASASVLTANFQFDTCPPLSLEATQKIERARAYGENLARHAYAMRAMYNDIDVNIGNQVLGRNFYPVDTCANIVRGLAVGGNIEDAVREFHYRRIPPEQQIAGLFLGFVERQPTANELQSYLEDLREFGYAGIAKRLAATAEAAEVCQQYQ